MRAVPAASVRVPRATEKQVRASAVAAVMLAVAAAVVVGGLGQESNWVGMQEESGSSPAARAGTEAPVAVDRETGWPGVAPRTASTGTATGPAKGRSSAPVAAGACGVVDK